MKNTYLFGILVCSLNLIADPDTTLLNEVTIIGSRMERITGSGEQISAERLLRLNQPDFTKVLRLVPGVNIRDEEGFGLRPNIGMRGTSVDRSRKITLMEDGILIAPAPYADPPAYYFPTFMRMEGVEVLKGSSQIKYGPYTIGGAINLLSTSIPDRFKASLSAAYGTFNTSQLRITAGDTKGNFSYVFDAGRWATDGFRQLDNGGNTGFERRDFMGKIRYETPSNAKIKQSIMLKFMAMTENSNETYQGLTFQDWQSNPLRRYASSQLDKLDMNHQHISLHYAIQPHKDLIITTQIYQNNTFRIWNRAASAGGQSVLNIINNQSNFTTPYQILTGLADGQIQYQSAPRTYLSNGIQSQAKYFFNFGQVKNTFSAAIRYHIDESDRRNTRSIYQMTEGKLILTQAGISGNAENQIRKAEALSGFVNYDAEFGRLLLSAGVRIEDVTLQVLDYGTQDNARTGANLKTASNSLTVLLPGVGFNYQTHSGSHLFGGIYKGFSPPGPPRLDSIRQAEAETAFNYELGYRISKDQFQFVATVFYNDYINILGSDAASTGGMGTGNMYNAGRATTLGFEFTAESDLLHLLQYNSSFQLPLRIAYTYSDSRFRETFINAGGDWGTGQINAGDLIPFINPHILTATLGLDRLDRWNFTLIARYTSAMRVRPGQGALIFPDQVTDLSQMNAVRSNWFFDLSGNYHLTPKVALTALINNLFNNLAIVSNLPQGVRTGMPFSVLAGVRFQIQ
ncbi:TonB-dependent receptor [Thermaurantimonas aggregans]|uniref:TonB-dependent receptor n=1 Tax=Thermaurantimonas aggregans TaxID=2173829 RepID=A0A401XMY2_9FLAO|nr:TonB-dependent receptor [Thermaurantimonas aggregans]MCX8149754.1 TonB-dependent receptor [Thermaurantimonas aggregans]GCD78381.1 TonB-dependent receptor [Thermaurantimonas aggregans]